MTQWLCTSLGKVTGITVRGGVRSTATRFRESTDCPGHDENWEVRDEGRDPRLGKPAAYIACSKKESVHPTQCVKLRRSGHVVSAVRAGVDTGRSLQEFVPSLYCIKKKMLCSRPRRERQFRDIDIDCFFFVERPKRSSA